MMSCWQISSVLQRSERLYVPGLWKHVEGLYRAEPVALGYQELGIPCERCGVTGQIPELGDAYVRNRGKRPVVASLARRIEEEHVGLPQHVAQRRRSYELLDSPGRKASRLRKAVAARVGDGFRDRLWVLFDTVDLPAAFREEERKRSNAAIEVYDALGRLQPRLEILEMRPTISTLT